MVAERLYQQAYTVPFGAQTSVMTEEGFQELMMKIYFSNFHSRA